MFDHIPIPVWIAIGLVFIGIGTYITIMAPWRADHRDQKKVTDKGRISRRIQFPSTQINQFIVFNADDRPIITEGLDNGNGVLNIPIDGGEGGPILSAWVENSELKIKVSIYDADRKLISFINGNEWVVHKSETIDCNYDAEHYEVITNADGKPEPILQVGLVKNGVYLYFRTFLSDGTEFRFGYDFMAFRKSGSVRFNVVAMRGYSEKDGSRPPALFFSYPSDENQGKRNVANEMPTALPDSGLTLIMGKSGSAKP